MLSTGKVHDFEDDIRSRHASNFHSTTQKSNIFANEFSSVGVRQELKKNEEAHRKLLESIKKLGEHYNK